MIVHACFRVVVVGQLRNIGHSLLWLLEDGKANGHIICSFQVLSIGVSEIFLSDIAEKLSIKGSKMTSNKRILSVTILFLDAIGNQARKTYEVLCGKEVAVNEPSIVLLENGVE